MASVGKYSVRSKIVLDNDSREQVSHFHYLGYDITNKVNVLQPLKPVSYTHLDVYKRQSE